GLARQQGDQARQDEMFKDVGMVASMVGVTVIHVGRLLRWRSLTGHTCAPSLQPCVGGNRKGSLLHGVLTAAMAATGDLDHSGHHPRRPVAGCDALAIGVCLPAEYPHRTGL